MHRRGFDLSDAQHLEQEAAADNVDNGVKRADLMKMYLLRRDAVNGRFGVDQEPVDAERFVFNVFGYIKILYNPADVLILVMAVRMLMLQMCGI